jgi:hypothetical protein
VNISVAAPEKLSDAGANEVDVDEVCLWVRLMASGAVVDPSGRTQW